MSLEEKEKEIRELSDLLRGYQYDYYVQNNPSVSDIEYDRLFDTLLRLESEYPELKQTDSPSVRVGSDLVSALPEVSHIIPVLSLDKGYSASEIEGWILKTVKAAGENLSFLIEEKIDGVSIVLYYENGILSRAVTRGNGYIGNDVTANVKTIGSVPLRLKEDITLSVRGEIYLPRESFEKINREMEIPYANPRNLAAGTIRRQKSSEAASVPLQIFVYEGFFSESYPPVNTHLEILQRLEGLGFRLNSRTGFFSKKETEHSLNIIDSHWNFGTFDDIPGYLERAAEERESLDYEIDGLVIKVNEIRARETLGYTGHHPRWAIAYKFESPQSATVIQDIDIQVGRTGRITPVARVKPVKIGGSVVSNVTLHNQDYINALEIALGDTVSVSKRGDVIPAVEEVLEKNEKGETTWQIPGECPSCGGSLEIVGAHHFCINESCPAQIKGRLKFFINTGQMDIENLGPETIEYLFSHGYVHDVEDLYSFDFSKLIGEPGFGEKKIRLIQEGLEKSKDRPFRTVLPSLGIPELGKKAAELLIENGVSSIEKLFTIAKNNDTALLCAIDGIGEKTAERIVTELRKEKYRRQVDLLKKAGLKFSEQKADGSSGPESNEMEGQVWCVTGSFENFIPRSKAMDEVKKRGGAVVSQISGKTTHLLAGSNPGSKLEKARKAGAQIVREPDFLKLLKG